MPRLRNRSQLFFRVAFAVALLVGAASSSGCREMAGKKKNKSPHAKAEDKDVDKKSESKKPDSKDGESKGAEPKKSESKSDAAAQ